MVKLFGLVWRSQSKVFIVYVKFRLNNLRPYENDAKINLFVTFWTFWTFKPLKWFQFRPKEIADL